MGQFVFMALWTTMTLVLALFALGEAAAVERAIFWLFPLVGALMTWVTWTRLRRRRSLRMETGDGATVYVWIDVDGRERRSDTDPRDRWDAEDGDGDGDGD